MTVKNNVGENSVYGVDETPKVEATTTTEESSEATAAEETPSTESESTEGEATEGTEAADESSGDESSEDGSSDGEPEGEAQEGEGDAVEASADEEEYTPNLTYEAYGEEHTIDEWAHGLITKDNEENFRKLFAGAAATEKMRTSLDSAQQTVAQLQEAVQGWESDVRDTLSLADEGDFDAFFDELKIPPQKVAQWLLEKLEVEKLSPEQQAVYHERSRLRRERREAEKQVRAHSTRATTAEFQTRTRELREAVSKPDVLTLAQQYDKTQGEAGAFLDFVIKNARAEFHASGGKTDLTAEQAVTAALKVLGLKAKTANPPPKAKAPSQVQKPKQKVITAPKTAVIPNVGSSNAAPTGFKPKSIEDLRKYSANLARGR